MLVQHKPLPALGLALGLSSSSCVMSWDRQQRDTQTGWHNSKELIHLQHLVMEKRDCPNIPDIQTWPLILPEACWRGWQPTALPSPAQAGPEKPSTRCPTKTFSERALSQQPGLSTGNWDSYLQMGVAEHPQPGCWLQLSWWLRDRATGLLAPSRADLLPPISATAGEMPQHALRSRSSKHSSAHSHWQ